MRHATQLHTLGYLADYMQIMNGSTLPGNVYEEGYGRVHTSALATGKWTLEQALDEAVTISLGCPRSARHLRPRRPEETRRGV